MGPLHILNFLAMVFAMASFARGFTVRHLSALRTVRSQSSRYFCAPASPEAEVTELSRLEIRVGKIVEIAKHPEADSLYVEKVDCGEPTGPRTIVSGLVQYCTVEQMQDRKVVVLANLKPRALKGIESHGMLLCASTGEEADRKVEPLAPPADAVPGELITFAGHKPQPEPPGNRASKAYSKLADDFFVNESGQATYKGTPFMTPQGPCTASLKGKIS
jgi:methionine--tRNA ligase beta chain